MRQEWLEKNPGSLEANFEKYYKSQKKGNAPVRMIVIQKCYPLLNIVRLSLLLPPLPKLLKRYVAYISINYITEKHRNHIRRMSQLDCSRLDW